MKIEHLLEDAGVDAPFIFFDSFFIKKGTLTRLNTLNKTLVQKYNELHLIFGLKGRRLTLMITW